MGEVHGRFAEKIPSPCQRRWPKVAATTVLHNLSGRDWSSAWLEARSQQLGPSLEEAGFFLPSFSCATASWTSYPMCSSEALECLCDVIKTIDAEFLDHNNIGTHSMKAGFLTLLGRSTVVRISPSERRLAGHHVDPAD